jgi:hypothetical protein
LTPSARSANLIAGDGTKNGFPAPNKEPAKTKNDHLTGKAPYKFESISLQEGVRCEPDLLDHGYIPDVLGGIEPSLVMPPELVIPPELVAEVTYLTWAAASVLRMVY